MEDLAVDEMNACLDTWSTLLLQNNMLKFFEELFGHVLLNSEGLQYASGLTYLPLVIPLYQKDIGNSITRILTVAGSDIDQLFDSIKEKIQIKENLKAFLARLVDKFLCDSSHNELYFLTVTSRIFALVCKTGVLNPDKFTEEVVGAVVDHALIQEETHLHALNIESLVENILKNPNSIDDFRTMKCGEAPDYFPS